MPVPFGIPDGWTTIHSQAFLLLCAAGVDGFEPLELSAIVPIVRRLGAADGNAPVIASQAYTEYARNVENDTVEDALMLHALELNRTLDIERKRAMMAVLQEVAEVDSRFSEGEQLVLTLLRQIWNVAAPT
jgi:uncharacterized tellurite resistance protein B-like protein